MDVLVGGVSELFQHDLDLGRLAIEVLQREDFGAGVVVEELHYGAVAVAQRLDDLRPGTLILISAVARDRRPGTVLRRRIEPPALSPALVQAAVGDAVTGYVHPDLVIDVAHAFGVLPARTIAIEIEPAVIGPGEGLSEVGERALPVAIELARLDVRRVPLLMLARQLRPLVSEDRLMESAALGAMRALLDELFHLDVAGHWGHSFAARDRLTLAIAQSESSQGMDARDWALWWAVIEEMTRLEALEALEVPATG